MRVVSERVILARYQSLGEGEIIEKAADDLVTVADRESEVVLTERLSALLPEATVVGEEACHADPSILGRLATDLCWIVDPIDGTHNFAHGHPPFGVLIALADKGDTLAGWILDCLSGRFCRTSRGGGAWVDGERVQSCATGEVPPVAAISTLFMDEDERARTEAHIAPHYRLVDIPRCAAEQYPRLVLGQNDVTVFNRALPWDHAAGALFLEEAGGKCARPDGSPYRSEDYERRGLLGAATPALWEELARRVETAMA